MAKQKIIYAGFWRRLLAYIIDTIILTGASFILGLLLAILIPGIAALESEFVWDIIGLMITWLYFASMESSVNQATLGKMALGLKVTDLKNKRISFTKATGRFFGKILSGLFLGIGFLMIAFTEKKQGLHDQLAGCLVVRK